MGQLQIDLASASSADTKTIEEALKRLDERVAGITKEYPKQVKLELAQARREVQELEALLSAAQKKANEATKSFQEFRSLSQHGEVIEKELEEKAVKRSDFDTANPPICAKVWEDASQNIEYFRKKEWRKNALLGCAAGIFLSLLYIGICELLRD